MNSKYTTLVKLKKQKLTDVEISLLNARQEQENLQNKLNNVSKQILSQKFPQSGNFTTMQSILMLNDTLKQEQQELKKQISLVNNSIYQLENSYKQTYMEYEKIKFLHDNEIKLQLERINKKIQNELDELAIIRHFRINKNAY